MQIVIGGTYRLPICVQIFKALKNQKGTLGNRKIVEVVNERGWRGVGSLPKPHFLINTKLKFKNLHTDNQ